MALPIKLSKIKDFFDVAIVKICSRTETGFGVSKTFLLKISFNSLDAFLFPSILSPSSSVHRLEGCSGTLIPQSSIGGKIPSTRGFYNEKSKTFFQPGVQS